MKQGKQRPASDYVTPQAKYAEHAEDMSRVSGAGRPGAPVYPLYGLGQADAASLVVWYRQPIFVLPAGIAVGFGLGWLWFSFMPSMKGRLKAVKNALRGKKS